MIPGIIIRYLFLFHQGKVISTGPRAGRQGGNNRMWPSVTGVYAMVIKYKRLMPVHLGSKRSGNAFCMLHHITALIVQTQDGRHTIPTGRAFQGR